MTSTIKVNKIEKVDGSTIELGGPGTSVNLASGATQTGFGRTGTVDWQTTPKTATFTAASGEGYFANTTSGGFTMNLPAGVANAIVSVADYAGTFQTHHLTISPNGSDKLGGTNATKILKTEGQSITLVFVDSTQGWINTMDSTSNVRGESFISASGGTETTCGDFKIHTFNSDATFTVSSVGTGSVGTEVSYVVVAGGGGGANWSGGGGGAGGYREAKQSSSPYTASPLATTGFTVSAQAYPITIGAGGSGQPAGTNWPSSQANNGNPSVFSTITSTGGGYGGSNDRPPNMSGGPGGSGGGGNRCSSGSGGTGNTPPVSPPQGNNGGDGAGGGPYRGGGGGGASAVGGDAPPSVGGTGGAGTTSHINGSPVGRAGGGAGGQTDSGGPAPASDGGGASGTGGGAYPGTSGTANTGGGGGAAGATSPSGSSAGTGGTGGSGVVIIRYKFQ